MIESFLKAQRVSVKSGKLHTSFQRAKARRQTRARRVEGTQSPPLIEPDGRISRIRLSEVVHRNGYRFQATVVGIFQS